MKNTLLLIAKGILWLVLVLALRPLNYMMDVCLAQYAKLIQNDDDFKPVKVTAIVVSVVVVILVLSTFFIIHRYG